MKNKEEMKCLICGSSDCTDYFYPPNSFNERVFSYYLCKSCNSAFIHPVPEKEDFDLIYGTDDHTYLKKLAVGEKLKFNYDFPLHDHQGHQIKFFEKFKYYNKGKSLLDIGCGSGFYMNYAKMKGMSVTGVEYNPEFAALLREKTDLDIFSFAEFEMKYQNQKFDLIHAGHFLEHLTVPTLIFDFIRKFSHDNTIIVFDGPLENNFCLSRLLIRTGSFFKRGKMNFYTPQHITFTDYFSQLEFFERQKLTRENYVCEEQLHPLPSSFDKKSLKKSALFIFGNISVNFSLLRPRWGNIFHYAGKFSK